MLALSGLACWRLIRAHVAALIVGAFVVGLLFNRRSGGKLSMGRAIVSLVLALGLMGGAAWALTTTLRLDLSEEGLEELASTAESQTDTGGSSVEGSAVRGPQDIPEATLRVLFRPLIHEASGAQLASGIEGTILLLVSIWRLPNLARNLFRMRHKPILLMSAAYTFGFIIVFSPFLNLGILARQRSQLMPFLIAWLIGAGWGEITAPGEEQSPTDPSPRRSPSRSEISSTGQPPSGSDKAESPQPGQHRNGEDGEDRHRRPPPDHGVHPDHNRGPYRLRCGSEQRHPADGHPSIVELVVEVAAVTDEQRRSRQPSPQQRHRSGRRRGLRGGTPPP